MSDRYTLAQDESTLEWVLTDTYTDIEIRWTERDFNETQKVTIIKPSDKLADASFLARTMREIGDFLMTNYREIL